MKRYPYFKEKIVEERDCFPNLYLNPTSALSFIQEVSGEHLAYLGYDYDRLISEGIVFMLSANAMKFYKTPVYKDKIIVATCPVEAKGAQMIRETVFMDENENILLENQASWVMINPKTQRIMRPNLLPVKLPLIENYDPFYPVWKLRFPEEGELLEKRKVLLSNLDRNNHMNNTVYAGLLTDAFPKEVMDGRIETLFIKYKKQARLNDELSLFGKKDEEGFHMTAKCGDEVYFQGSFTLNKIK